MEDEREKVIKAYKLFTKFLERLDDAQLSKWLEGEAKLTLEGGGKTKKVKQEDVAALSVYIDQLKNMKSCEEAEGYLKQLKLKKPQLKELALKLAIHIKSSDTMKVMSQKIVEETVGSKLKMEILSNKEGKN